MKTLSCGFDWSIASKQHSDAPWRDGRKIFQKYYNAQAIKRYRHTETKAAHVFLRNLLKTPQDFFQHVRQ